MFPRSRYIAWAMEHYGKVRWDLASSGIPAVGPDELPLTAPSADVGDYARLRVAIARYNDVPEACVVPALGTSHAIFLAYASLLSPGDEILVEEPGYEPLLRAAEGLGVTARRFPRLASDGFRVDPARVAALMTPRTRLIVVTTLHNPTGVRVDDPTIVELAAIAAARGAYVLVDEVYAPFDDLPEDGVFARSARKLAPNVIAIGSLTKCYGLGMHRLGWVLGPDEVVEGATATTVATLGHLPLSHASHGIQAFAAVGTLARRARALVSGKRAVVEQWLAARPHVAWSAPGEGLYGLVTLPGQGDLRPRIEEHCARSGVLVGAGSFFGAAESFRLSWAAIPTAELESALSALAPLVDAAS